MGKQWVLGVLCLVACGGGGDESCDDPKYGDGTCDLQTSCTMSDVDCFTTFATQAEAQAWYGTTTIAATRPAVPASEPRFARMQMLLDQGWEAYKSVNDVGDLKDARVHLVLANQALPNAFVTQKDGKAGLVVMVSLELLDLNAPDEEVMGIVMHELEHTIALHVLPEVKASFNQYYVAPPGSEPFGFEQPDNAAARAIIEEWVDNAETIGYLSDTELRGFPMFGQVFDVFAKRLSMQPVSANCTTAKNNYNTTRNEVLDARDPLTDGVSFTATASMTFQTRMTDINTGCFAGFTMDLIDVAAAHYEVSRDDILKDMPADLRPLVEGVAFVQGVYNMGIYTRTKMRELEAQFMTMTGQPWSRARYYSTEEAADDSSVPVLRAMGLPADGAGKIFPKLKAGVEAACRPLVTAGTPIPYGENVEDDHHGLCWRAGHIDALAKSGRVPQRAPFVLTSPRKRTIFSQPLLDYSH